MGEHDIQEPLLATEKRAAELLGMTYSALKNARQRDVLDVPPHMEVGGRLYYRVDCLKAWMDKKVKECRKYTL